MSCREKDRQSRALVARPAQEVGHGNPPGRPGSSRAGPEIRAAGQKGGNEQASGSPRGADEGIILDETYPAIAVRDGGRKVIGHTAQAIIRSLAVCAAKGQHHAQRNMAESLAPMENASRALHDAWLDIAMTCEIDWEREVEQRARLGVADPPDPLQRRACGNLPSGSEKVFPERPFAPANSTGIQSRRSLHPLSRVSDTGPSGHSNRP